MRYLVISVILILFVFCVGYWIGKREKIPLEDIARTTDLYKEIDSLNVIIESISFQIDSLQHVIDTSQKTIVNISMEYEEKYLDLYSAPISKQLEFFSNYLSESN